MGQIEKRGKERVRRARVRDAVLLSLYGSAVVAVAIMLPNAARLLKHLDPLVPVKRDPESRLRESLQRLVKRGLVRKTGMGSDTRYVLTKSGEKEAVIRSLIHNVQQKQKWDGKWRVIIFDVWERRRAARDRLRALLIETGFVRLQDSVWVFPYPCEELVAYMRIELKLGPGLLYILADGIESEHALRKQFGLPSDSRS